MTRRDGNRDIAGAKSASPHLGQIWHSSLALVLLLASSSLAMGQAAPAVLGVRDKVSLGGTFSAYRLSYGERLLLGASIYVDIEYNQHYGIEAEGRWLWLHQRDGVRDESYLIGPRYSFNGVDERKRIHPYVRFLVGFADFRYPYSYATGKYFALAPGGGVDYRINGLIRVRLVDVEDQLWPQFTFGPHSSLGISSGLRVRAFWM